MRVHQQTQAQHAAGAREHAQGWHTRVLLHSHHTTLLLKSLSRLPMSSHIVWRPFLAISAEATLVMALKGNRSVLGPRWALCVPLCSRSSGRRQRWDRLAMSAMGTGQGKVTFLPVLVNWPLTQSPPLSLSEPLSWRLLPLPSVFLVLSPPPSLHWTPATSESRSKAWGPAGSWQAATSAFRTALSHLSCASVSPCFPKRDLVWANDLRPAGE